MNAYDLTQFKRLAPVRQPMASYDKGRARVPGTCGELMQGTLGGVDFLINSPIPYFADIKVTINHESIVSVVTPGHYTKVERAVRHVLDLARHYAFGADIEILQSIPRGKGLASSTAEVTAAIAATSLALGKHAWKKAYVDVVLEIDQSTDAVYVPGIANCSFLTGGIIERYSSPTNLSFIVVDAGGEVETVSFDRKRARRVAEKHSHRLFTAYKTIRHGLRYGNAAMVAQACTQSTLINQEVLPKPLLGALLQGTHEFGALGINCAHTGTVLGVMFNPNAASAASLLKRVEMLVGKEKVLGVYPLISGGTR